MKSKIGLFLFSFFIIFIGMSSANIIACVIYGFSDGTIFLKISELPYKLYAIFSLIISIIYLCLMLRKTKK